MIVKVALLIEGNGFYATRIISQLDFSIITDHVEIAVNHFLGFMFYIVRLLHERMIRVNQE